jgi:osmotically-inducible protein OsmY
VRHDISKPEAVAAVRDALEADPEVGPWAPRIRVIIGDTWRIEGEVGSVAARRKAVRVARQALPAVDFADGVRVTPRIPSSDEALVESVREAVQSEPALTEVTVVESGTRPPPVNSPWIGVLAHDSVVYLGGCLDAARRSMAEALAWDTGACADVVNLISWEPRKGDFDAAIRDALRTLMTEHPALSGQRIRVGASHGEITLSGEVADPGQSAVAVGLCWLVPDVRGVHNHLKMADGGGERSL